MKIFTFAMNTFKEAVRDKTILLVGIIGFVFLAVSKIFVPISVGEAFKIINDFGLALVEIFSLIIIIFIGTRILYDEIERKTIYNIISKPVKRWEFLTGKLVGLTILILTIQIILYIFFLLFQKLYLHMFILKFLSGLYFLFFEMFLLNGVAIFFSTFATPITAGIFTFLIYFIGNTSVYLKELVSMVKIPSLNFIVNILYYILPNFSIMNIKGNLVYNLPLSPSLYLFTAAYSILYVIILLTFSSIIFDRREFY